MMIGELLDIIESKPLIPSDTQNVRAVIVNNDGDERKSTILNGLDKQASLSEIRKILSLNDEILMSKQNSYFWNDNSKNRISQDDENKLILQNILIPKQNYYHLYIAIDPSKPNFLVISKKYQLCKGRKTGDNHDVIANSSAFAIKTKHMINVNLQCKFEHRKTEEYVKMCYELGSVRLSRKDLEPTEGYIRAIEEALDESKSNDEKKRELDMVGEEYGFFW